MDAEESLAKDQGVVNDEREQSSSMTSDSDTDVSSTSSEASGDYEDEKRRAAETFKDWFLKVAQESASQASGMVKAKTKHALSDWWSAGAIAGSKRKRGLLEKDDGSGKIDIRLGSDSEEEEVQGEEMKWVADTEVKAKGIEESLKEAREKSNESWSKKLDEKKKGNLQSRWAPTPKPEKAVKPVHWIDMASAKMTDEVKRDLAILKMRDTLDPTRFYKKLDMKKEPKWLQVGTVVDNPYDGRHGRLPNRLRKKTIAEQWLADPEVTAARTKRIQTLKDAAAAENKILFKNQPYLKKHRKKLRR